MSFYKAIKYRKERRKPYRDSRRFDVTCRNHKCCPRCRDKRTFFDRKRRSIADAELKEHGFSK